MGWAAEQVVSVDHHRGDEHAGTMQSREQYFGNLERYDVTGKVVVVVADWRQAVPFLQPSFGLVFLDADHGEDAVYDQLVAVMHLAPTIAVHDYGRFGVKAAVVHFMREYGWKLSTLETLAILRMPEDD
jgi:methyltransferase family protein